MHWFIFRSVYDEKSWRNPVEAPGVAPVCSPVFTGHISVIDFYIDEFIQRHFSFDACPNRGFLLSVDRRLDKQAIMPAPVSERAASLSVD